MKKRSLDYFCHCFPALPVHLRFYNKKIDRFNTKGIKTINLFGAGDGNRTHVASLEGWSSAIELHPQYGAVDEIRTRDIHLGKVALYH